MRVGLYIGNFERSARILEFLEEYFSGNCFVYSYLTAGEIYSVPHELDVLFLDTNHITSEEFIKIEETVKHPIILLDNKVKSTKNNISISLLFNNLNYTRAIKKVIDEARSIEKLIHFKKRAEKLLIPLNNIIYIKGDDRESELYLSTGKEFKTNERLKHLHTRIKDERFLLLHSDYAVNMDFVKVIKADTAVMTNGISIPVKNYNKKSIIDEFYKYKITKHNKNKQG